MKFRGTVALLGLLAGVFSTTASALDYRSVAAPAILYDTPTQKGTRVLVVSAGTPLEVIVTLEKWVKVRDRSGRLAWIARNDLSDTQSVMVVAERASVRDAATNDATTRFEATRGVILQVAGPPKGNWLPVRHADGDRGYVRRVDVWGY